MKFEQRKSEIIKGHEIVKTPRADQFKIKMCVEGNDGFLFNSDKKKACGLMRKIRNQAWQPKKVIFTVTTLGRSL